MTPQAYFCGAMFHSTSIVILKTTDRSVRRQKVLASEVFFPFFVSIKEGMNKHVLFPSLWDWEGISKTHEIKFIDSYIQCNFFLSEQLKWAAKGARKAQLSSALLWSLCHVLQLQNEDKSDLKFSKSERFIFTFTSLGRKDAGQSRITNFHMLLSSLCGIRNQCNLIPLSVSSLVPAAAYVFVFSSLFTHTHK